MTIPSEKPLKRCKFCGKEVRNLGFHVANNHPNIMEQLEETLPSKPDYAQIARPQQENRASSSSINELIREKLETMMNIKIIEMMSSSKDVSLAEIGKAINPPQPLALSEIKA